MTGRRSSAVVKALKLVERGSSLREAAKIAGCDVSSVVRARRADGKERRPPGVRPAKP